MLLCGFWPEERGHWCLHVHESSVLLGSEQQTQGGTHVQWEPWDGQFHGWRKLRGPRVTGEVDEDPGVLQLAPAAWG